MMIKSVTILNFALCLLLTQVTSFTSEREKRNPKPYDASSSNQYGDSPLYSAPLAPFNQTSKSGYYPETPLAPFPSHDQNRYSNQGNYGNNQDSRSHYQVQPGIKGGRIEQWNQNQWNGTYYQQSGSTANPLYPSLSHLQQWNHSNPNSQWQSGHQWNQSNPNSQWQSGHQWNQTNPNYGNRSPTGNQDNYGSNYPNQWNQTNFGNRGSSGGQGNYPGQQGQWNSSYPGNQGYYGNNPNQWNQTNLGNRGSFGNQGNPWNQTGNNPWTQSTLGSREPTYGNNYSNQKVESFNDPNNPWRQTALGNRSGYGTPGSQNYGNNYPNQWNQTHLGNRGSSGGQGNYPGQQGQWNSSYPGNQGYYGNNPNQWNQSRPGSNQGAYGSEWVTSTPSYSGHYGGNQWNQSINTGIKSGNQPYGGYGNQWNQTHFGNQGRYDANNQPWSGNQGNYGQQWNQTHPGSQNYGGYSTGQPTFGAIGTKSFQQVSSCISSCSSSSDYAPVCGSDMKTYSNLQELVCAKNCGTNVRFAYNGSC